MRRAFSVLVLALCAACGGSADNQTIGSVKEELRPVATVSGAPTDRLAQSSPLSGASSTQALGVFEGRAAAATRSGLFASSSSQVDVLTQVPVYLEDGGVVESGTEPTGGIAFIARRGSSGAFVVADQGLFHDQDGLLVKSPLSETLSGKQVFALDDYGAAADEELWLLSAEGLLHVGGGQLSHVSITGVTAQPEAVIGIGAQTALVAVGGALYQIDLGAKTATKIMKGVGHVASFERSEDGAVYFATDSGLIQVAKTGELSLRTLAADGAPAVSVSAVVAAYGSLAVATDTEVVSLESSGAFRIGSVSGVIPHGLSIDTNGDTFAATAAALTRFKTGQPVSYADVKPFFTAHCATCHRAGLQSAPPINFEDYETARTWGPEALKRLNAIGVSPMPPPNTETLTAADYAVVTRWVGGGMAP